MAIVCEEVDSALLPEQRKTLTSLAVNTNVADEESMLKRYSNLDKLLRVIALCKRFYTNCKIKGARQTGLLTNQEITGALYLLCRRAQARRFSDEVRVLSNGQQISSRSRILSLSPFLDEQGILRVGGRLRNSSLAYSSKHQILLPANHFLTQLIIRNIHEKNLHSGAQATLAFVRHEFWPISARNTVRKIVQKCIICIKHRPVASQCKMGDLPAHRVQSSRPFMVCGVDYGGPLYVRDGKRRNAKTIKAYMAIFVCFATKAVHLELVDDLSTEAFLNSLKRFMARRGRISHIYSDNATNFTEAARELQELHNLFKDEQHKGSLEKFLAVERITWHFIPPNAPNFGGLWEAAIKSAKTYLRKIIGQAHLNYEEMYTLLVQIEAILNSRPITPLSNDPNDLFFLSPGHFLIGDALNSYVEPSLAHLQSNRLSRWQHVEQLRQHFWKRWHTEYLHQLQQRTRWQTNKGKQLQSGQMVLVQQQGLSPLHWILSCISKIYPGADGLARTATILTSKGTFDRPISKLCILPLDE